MTSRARQDRELVPKRQVLEDEILARFEGRSECVRESGDDLEHRAQSGRDHCGRSTIPWVDGVLARDRCARSCATRSTCRSTAYYLPFATTCASSVAYFSK